MTNNKPTERETQRAIRQLRANRRPVTEESITKQVKAARFEAELIQQQYESHGAVNREWSNSWCPVCRTYACYPHKPEFLDR
jgi:hypothetical protein